MTAAVSGGLKLGSKSFLAMVLHSNNPQKWKTSKINTSRLPVSTQHPSESESLGFGVEKIKGKRHPESSQDSEAFI